MQALTGTASSHATSLVRRLRVILPEPRASGLGENKSRPRNEHDTIGKAGEDTYTVRMGGEAWCCAAAPFPVLILYAVWLTANGDLCGFGQGHSCPCRVAAMRNGSVVRSVEGQ